MVSKIDLYDELAGSYDLMVDWESRLDAESVFLRQLLADTGARRVLDLACGTGMHSILFARWGYDVVAADPSERMLDVARENAHNAGVRVEFLPLGFGEIGTSLKQHFDVVFCLGNSLPHLLSVKDLALALQDVFFALRPGGKFVTQNRNYDKVWAEKSRFMPLDAVERDGKEVLFFRLLDFHEEMITFNIVTLVKQAHKWSYSVSSTKHRPLFKDEIERLLGTAGFSTLQFYGDLRGNPYIRDGSGDLVVVAGKPS